MRILIAEDEARIARFVARGLKASGYTATIVEDGISALDYAASGEFDLLILDVGLPRMDGFTVMRNLRELGHQIPIIMATARDSVEDRVHGLESGANDYLPKPFRIEELIARIKLRLHDSIPTTAGGGASDEILVCGSLNLNVRTRIASTGEYSVELSGREFALASVFLHNPGQVLSREQLLSRVWGFDYDGASNVVDVYVRYLRKKLGNDRFVTVRGAGYKLIDPEYS